MFTPVQLDKMRNFRYGMVAIHRIEQMLQTKIAKLDLNDLSIYELSVIVWAGLVHEDSSLTPETVMEMIDEHSSMVEITEALAKAFTAGFGGQEGDEKKAKRATK